MNQDKIDKVNIEGDPTNLKAGEGITIDEKTKYEYAANLNTEGAPLIDPDTGKTIAIRLFDFKMNPQMIKDFPSDRQQIFNAHAKQIATILWADGLRPLDEVAPRVIINRQKASYQIFVPCEARRDVVFADKAQSLTQHLTKTNEHTRY